MRTFFNPTNSTFAFTQAPGKCSFFFFKLGFTPCKAERPLRGMELQEKKAQKRLQDTENLFTKNLQLKDVC